MSGYYEHKTQNVSNVIYSNISHATKQSIYNIFKNRKENWWEGTTIDMRTHSHTQVYAVYPTGPYYDYEAYRQHVLHLNTSLVFKPIMKDGELFHPSNGKKVTFTGYQHGHCYTEPLERGEYIMCRNDDE